METDTTNTVEETVEAPSIPPAVAMLDRLYGVDTTQFNIDNVTEELKGDKAWLFVLTMPVAAIVLVVFTLLGTFLTGYFIASFIVIAALLLMVGKMLDQYEQKFRHQARLEVMRRIEAAETEEGLIPHFRDFLPKKYRHLWQSLRKKNYIYVDQYIAAITLLQQRLEPEKFVRIWHLKYPDSDPNNQTSEASETSD